MAVRRPEEIANLEPETMESPEKDLMLDQTLMDYGQLPEAHRLEIQRELHA